MRLPTHASDATHSSRTNQFLQQGRGQLPQPDTRAPSLQNRRRSDASDWTEELDDADEALPLPVEEAQAIDALLCQLHALKPPLAHKLGAIIHLCQAMKSSESDAVESEALMTRLLRDYPEAVEVRQLRRKFSAFLQDFHAALQSTNSQRQIQPESLTQQQIQYLCQAVSVCLPPSGERLFQRDFAQQDGKALQGITDVLLTQAMALGLPEAVQANGEVLDILNCVSRGLKAGLLKSSEPIRNCFAQSLGLIEDWTGGDQCRQLLSEHNLGRCAVQIGTILHHQLIDLDPARPEGAAHRQRLGQCALALCAKPVLDRLVQQGDTVSLLNICNTVKDQLTMGVLRQNDPALAELILSLNRLVDAMGRLPASALFGSLADCQPLSNFSNLLRTLAEPAGKDQPALAEHLPQFEPTCKKFIETICGVNLKQVYPSSLAASNLQSFAKVCDKRAAKRMAETATATPVKALSREELGQAAGILIGVLMEYGAAEFTQPRAIGGVLAGLAYFWVCNPALRSDALQDLIKALVAKAGVHRWADWNDQSRRAVLPALTLLLREGTIDLHISQPALQQIMGASHAVTLQTLQKKSREYKLADEVPLPMPVVLRAPAAQTKEVEKKEEAPTERVIPGLTRLRAPVVMTTTNTTQTTTTTTVTPPYRGQTTTTPLPFQAPKKVAKADKLSASALPHTMPVVVDRSRPETETTKPPQTKPATPEHEIKSPRKTSPKEKKAVQAQTTQTKKTDTRPAKKWESDVAEWFDLLQQKEGEPLPRLKELVKNNRALLAMHHDTTWRTGCPLFYAINSGKPRTTEWLMNQTAREDRPLPVVLLQEVFSQTPKRVSMLQQQALGKFIEALPKAAKNSINAYYERCWQVVPADYLHVLIHFGLDKTKDINRSFTDLKPVMWADLPFFKNAGASKKLARVLEDSDTVLNPSFTDSTGRNFLGICYLNNFKEVMTALFQSQYPVAAQMAITPDKLGCTVLRYAIEANDIEMVRLLASTSTFAQQVHIADLEGVTPLIMAAMRGNTSIIEILLGAGSATDQLLAKTHGQGGNALMVAAGEGHHEVVKLLLQHTESAGLQVTTQEMNAGGNALMIALSQQHNHVVEVLLNAGPVLPQILANKNDGDTPLMVAIKTNNVEGVHLLLEQTATVSAQLSQRTADGMTMLNLAVKYNQPLIMAMISLAYSASM